MEKDPTAFAELDRFLKARPGSVRTVPHHGEFGAFVPELQKWLGSDAGLIFVDPTGWKGAAMRFIAPLVAAHPRRDVLVNVMFDHINRFKDDPRTFLREQMPRGASHRRCHGGPSWGIRNAAGTRDRGGRCVSLTCRREPGPRCFADAAAAVIAERAVAGARARHAGLYPDLTRPRRRARRGDAVQAVGARRGGLARVAGRARAQEHNRCALPGDLVARQQLEHIALARVAAGRAEGAGHCALARDALQGIAARHGPVACVADLAHGDARAIAERASRAKPSRDVVASVADLPDHGRSAVAAGRVCLAVAKRRRAVVRLVALGAERSGVRRLRLRAQRLDLVPMELVTGERLKAARRRVEGRLVEDGSRGVARAPRPRDRSCTRRPSSRTATDTTGSIVARARTRRRRADRLPRRARSWDLRARRPELRSNRRRRRDYRCRERGKRRPLSAGVTRFGASLEQAAMAVTRTRKAGAVASADDGLANARRNAELIYQERGNEAGPLARVAGIAEVVHERRPSGERRSRLRCGPRAGLGRCGQDRPWFEVPCHALGAPSTERRPSTC